MSAPVTPATASVASSPGDVAGGKRAAEAASAEGPRRPTPKRPPPPGRVTIAADSEQQRYLRSLERSVRAGRRWSLWLALGVAAVVVMSPASWLLYYASAVLTYAQLGPDIRIERDPENPDRLTLIYRPLSRGIVGFRHADAGRETEVLDRVALDPAEPEQQFQWQWSGVKPGSQVKVIYRRGWAVQTDVLDVPQTPPRPPMGDAVLVGEVVGAIDKQPVPNAEVKIVGTRLSARTGPDGRFRLADAPPSPVPIQVSAANFSTEDLDKDVMLVSKHETPLRVVLSPGIKTGQIRLVLTWGQEPADLDAHLEGPLPDGKQFHIYFQQKGDLKSREFVSLDADAKNGFGPETITVLGVLPGRYHYFVHDYTNRDVHSSTALSRSGTEVKIYQGGQAYSYRTNKDSPGNVWHVCDIEINKAGTAVSKKSIAMRANAW